MVLRGGRDFLTFPKIHSLTSFQEREFMSYKIRWRSILALACLSVLLVQVSPAQNLADFEKKVTEFTLDNGLKFIVVERHEAPVASFYTYADVGSVDEVKGITGLAHVFEHMAFKGTTTVGTKDLAKEQEAMKKEDEAFDRLRRERNKGALADSNKIKQLEQEFEAAKKAAQEWVKSNEMGEAIDRAGGVGLNASTNWDATDYYYSLPSNKMELWFSLEADRFLNPVLREFYTEKNVVMEERRLRTESQPFGRLIEEFFSAAYKAHPYGEPVVGHMSDLKTMTRAEAEAFFKKYYGANNLTIAIAGDVNPTQVKQLAQTYFGRLPASPKPDPVETVEPEQLGERRVVVEDKAQPIVAIGYHKGNIYHPDDAIFTVMSDILGRGRTSRFHKTLVKDKKIAIDAGSVVGIPGSKYPNLMIMYAVTSKGHTAEECEAVMYEEIERLKNEPVSAEELKKSKTNARADLIRRLDSNSEIAGQLAFYQAVTGDWRNLFRRLDQIDAVTAADIQRVAKQYLIAKHRSVGLIKTVGSL
jgi:predicted Zn-dependent peptidase